MASALRPAASPRERRERLLFALLFAIFTYWPLAYNFYLSFVRWNFLRPRKPFVGLSNYVKVFSDSQFWAVVLNTLTFTLCSVGLTLLIGLGLALLIDQPLRYRMTMTDPNTLRAAQFYQDSVNTKKYATVQVGHGSFAWCISAGRPSPASA